jgi:hypothetical protein
VHILGLRQWTPSVKDYFTPVDTLPTEKIRRFTRFGAVFRVFKEQHGGNLLSMQEKKASARHQKCLIAPQSEVEP